MGDEVYATTNIKILAVLYTNPSRRHLSLWGGYEAQESNCAVREKSERKKP